MIHQSSTALKRLSQLESCNLKNVNIIQVQRLRGWWSFRTSCEFFSEKHQKFQVKVESCREVTYIVVSPLNKYLNDLVRPWRLSGKKIIRSWSRMGVWVWAWEYELWWTCLYYFLGIYILICPHRVSQDNNGLCPKMNPCSTYKNTDFEQFKLAFTCFHLVWYLKRITHNVVFRSNLHASWLLRTR